MCLRATMPTSAYVVASPSALSARASVSLHFYALCQTTPAAQDPGAARLPPWQASGCPRWSGCRWEDLVQGVQETLMSHWCPAYQSVPRQAQAPLQGKRKRERWLGERVRERKRVRNSKGSIRERECAGLAGLS